MDVTSAINSFRNMIMWLKVSLMRCKQSAAVNNTNGSAARSVHSIPFLMLYQDLLDSTNDLCTAGTAG